MTMRVYTKVIPMRWGDMDAMNHLNNTLYFRLMEEARISWFHDYDLMMRPDGEGPILAHASCDFIKPMTYPCETRVTQSVVRVGRSSLEVEMTIEGDETPPALYAKGKNVLVWVDYTTGTSAAWPDRIRQALEASEEG